MAITIKLDRERTLKYSMAASVAFKQAYKKGLKAALFGEPSELVTDDDCLRFALWAGLRHEDDRLTPDAVTELLDAFLEGGGDLGDLVRAMTDAMVQCGILGLRKPGKAKAETTS